MQRYLLALAGLALYASSLGAQDYVDLEQERLEAARAREQQSYQGSSAATSTTPSTSPYQASSSAAPAQELVPEPVPAQADSGPNFGQIYNQLQMLQREVMELRGQMEEQAYELRQLKQQSLERYVDLDRRVSGGAGTAAANSPDKPNATSGSSPAPAGAGVAQPGESDAYRAAYGLVRNQQFPQAVDAFKQFLQKYPDGKYAPNANYWLGELYLVSDPPDLEAARRAFTMLLEQYPDNSKIPDALYKLGRVYFQKGNPGKAREYLDRVVGQYGDSGSSAVNLARDFIAENY